MRLQFETVDVFTSDQFSGNPLAVVLNAEGLSTQQESFRRMMDTRVKPAYDSAYVATFCENFRIQISNSHAASFPRRRASWAFSLSPLDIEGRRDAERRTLVTAAAYFPDCRETEAHGNASQRPAAAS